MTRKKILYANTQLTCARFIPSGVQILATGNDRHISYWEVYDASLVRNVEGSAKGAVNCLSLNSTGEMFATAGTDQIVRVIKWSIMTISMCEKLHKIVWLAFLIKFQLWDYETGVAICIGHGHAANIISCKYSPCGKFVVSGSADGAVIIWNVPQVNRFAKISTKP